MTTVELEAVRAAMSRETKKQFRDGIDTLAEIAVYLEALRRTGMIPSDLFRDYIEFTSLLALISEGRRKHDNTRKDTTD